MIVGLIAIAVTSQKGIELQPRVVRVPELVAELASKSSESLTAAANLKNEVVYINLRAKGVAELMKLIAEVTGCEWIKRENRTELTRTTQKLREDELRERQWDIQKLTNVIAKMTPPNPVSTANADGLVKRMTDIFSGKETVKSPYDFVESLRPVNRMLHKVMTAQPPVWALTVPPSTRGVFADAPNRLQRAMPVRMSGFMNAFTEEDRAFRRALENAGATGASFRGDALGYLNDEAANDFTSPLTPYMVVNRIADTQLEIRLQIMHPKALELVSASVYIPLEIDSTDKNTLAEVFPVDELLPIDPNSPKTKSGRLNPKTDARLLEVMRKPLDMEPLKVTLETPLNALFKKSGKEGLFSLNDDLATATVASAEGMRLSELIRVFHFTMNVEARGDLLIGRPRHAFYTWNTRADRAAMQNLIARSTFGVPMLLDVLADYASKQTPMAGCENFEQIWLCRTIHGKSNSDEFNFLSPHYGYRDALRFWGGLGKAQKDLFRSGGELSFQELSTVSRSALSAALFEHETFLEPGTGLSNQTPLSMLLPNGMLSGAYIQSKSKVDPSVVYETKDGNIAFSSAGSAGYVLSQQERGQFLDPALGYLLMDGAQYRPLQTLELALKIKLAPEIGVNIYLRDYAFDPSVKAVPWENLKGPEGDQFRKTLEYYRKMFTGGG